MNLFKKANKILDFAKAEVREALQDLCDFMDENNIHEITVSEITIKKGVKNAWKTQEGEGER